MSTHILNSHIMIDIETLDTNPTAAIIEIAAVEFYPERGLKDCIGGRTFSTDVDLDSAVKAGTVSGATLEFWLGQPARVTDKSAPSLSRALSLLMCFIRETPGEINLWANSPSFDMVILEHAYRQIELRAPWTHRQLRDVRTICWAASLSVDSFRVGRQHHALDDAITQALAVTAAWNTKMTK